ncbi:Homeobox-leucine zipper protein HDG2 [Prunus yedoensis var. nudiflora]|uniref:Homeobox-leucine zipper protein HDG2 n=1 Tax=Prunus yedoensis var. nudiflora TaxID=2094558 RepID=A0A314XSY3_PRUYE|nr:Homeobox-leucine zipper protein HDG2 [Prunus yedoensis var. nudiflora]
MEAGPDPCHTQHQIQEMEAFFTECPHLDAKQRKELSRELGLEPLQVKFWFRNKRTEMKHVRHVHTQLRNENEKLRADIMMYREALGSASCPNCDGPTTIREMSFDKADKPLIIEIAVAAMEELIRMAQMGEPLWMTSLGGNTTVFNEDEYIKTFPRVAPKPNNHFKREASLESAVVTMNHINLVAILMDVHLGYKPHAILIWRLHRF